jgi:hypothetical protein
MFKEYSRKLCERCRYLYKKYIIPSLKPFEILKISLVLVGVLDWQTYQGGTRGSRLCGEDHDRETETSKVCARTRDTRFI